MLFFFRSSQVAKWSENLFREKSNTGVFSIVTWLKFEELFYTHFFLINAKIEVINKLEETSYCQDSYLVKDYLNKFQALIFKTGYIDSYTIIVKFRVLLYH